MYVHAPVCVCVCFVQCVRVCRYPNGWYRVANSDELKPGDVKHIQCVGQQLALFRGRNDKKVHVLDAYW